jgi:hypothetical protein
VKILLDHCLDWRLVRHLPGHDVAHTGKLGWGQLKNGVLLRKAEESAFAVFVTSDKNLPFQQNVSKLKLAVVVFDVPSNRIEDCIPKCPLLRSKLPALRAGTVTLL